MLFAVPYILISMSRGEPMQMTQDSSNQASQPSVLKNPSGLRINRNRPQLCGAAAAL